MRNDITLRGLEEKDAPGMYEWMHDPITEKAFRKNMAEKTIEDVYQFIETSKKDTKNLNFAICDETDEYLGTISLKGVDYEKGDAEFAIALRKKARGCGVGEAAIHELVTYAFDKLKLNRIHLNVVADNERAIRLYKKAGFIYESEIEEIFENDGKLHRQYAFAISR